MRRCLVLCASGCLLLSWAVVSAGGQGSAPAPAQSADALDTVYAKAMQSKDWAGAVSAAEKMVEASATAKNLVLLANAQLNSGAAQESLATYDRALAAAQAEKAAQGQPLDVWKGTLGKIYTGKGNALLKLHRNSDAVEAYTRAAELDQNPGRAYFNICAVQYNTGYTENAVMACRKSLAADPTRADAWFVLASLLFVDAKIDAQGKFLISSECRQALEKYMELAPTGPHAADVKQMLDAAGR
jgi:tetratricopeptide (TPR) repeat protein